MVSAIWLFIIYPLIEDRFTGWGNSMIDNWLASRPGLFGDVLRWTLDTPLNLVSTLFVVIIAIIIVDWYRQVRKQVRKQNLTSTDGEQRKQIAEYEEKENVHKASKIRFGVDNKDCNVGIRVVNDEQKTFEGQLLLAKKDGKPLFPSLELGVYEHGTRVSKLEWPRTMSRVIDLASLDKGTKKAFFIGLNNNYPPIEKSRDYLIETNLVGKLGDGEIEPKKMEWILTFDKEKLILKLRKNV